MRGFVDECVPDGHQTCGKTFFWERPPVQAVDILHVKNFLLIALSCTVSDKCVLLFMQKFKMAAIMVGKHTL